MTAPDPLRRKLVVGLGAAGAMAAAGGVWWVAGRGDGAGTAATTSTGAPTTTGRPGSRVAPTSTTTTTSTSTSEPPATTTTAEPSSTTDGPATSTTTAPPILAVIPRGAWGAAAATAAYTDHVVERLTVHHTGRILERNELAPQRLRGHQRFHQRDRGWVDLAYHYMIDADGNVYEGRPATAVGDTATNYDPTGHLLVCCEGNFEEQDLPESQRASLVDVLAAVAVAHRIGVDTISGHRDHAATACPGAGIIALLDGGRLRERVEERVMAGAPAIELSTAGDGAARVQAIERG